jgi:hypothetical protein
MVLRGVRGSIESAQLDPAPPRLSPEALHQPKSFETLERHVADPVRAHCPQVIWPALAWPEFKSLLRELPQRS